MKDKKLKEWHFDFGLFTADPKELIPGTKCEELMDLIIKWVESNDLKVGGGFREYPDEDKKEEK